MTHPIQSLIDAMGDAARMSRANYHLTLGEAIKTLRELPADMPLRFDWQDAGPTHPHSYRGYYSDLAFENGPASTAGAFLELCTGALGQIFEGYKGGDFLMDERTPLWASSYGSSSGRALMGIDASGGKAAIITKVVD